MVKWVPTVPQAQKGRGQAPTQVQVKAPPPFFHKGRIRIRVPNQADSLSWDYPLPRNDLPESGHHSRHRGAEREGDPDELSQK